ncbi:phosphate regulon sensor histidine kinase PhoR [Aliidiomarina sp. Khilg15.8]
MGRDYSVYRVLRGLFWYLAPFVIIGWLLDMLWPLLTLALALKLAWHYYFMQRLGRWLWQSRTLLPPKAAGVWTDVYDGIYRTLRRNQFRRRALTTLIKRFRQAAEAMPDAAVVLQQDGTLTWANKLAQIYFGLQWPNDSGIRITNLIRHPRFVKYFNGGEYGDSVTLRSPAQAAMELEVRIMPYADNQYLMIARDVTQLRKLERMRKDFVANVSHELKTPLTVMQGYLEMLDEPDLMPAKQTKKAVADMQAQALRMQNMVSQLLELSRIESSSPDSFTQRVPMPSIINTVMEEVELLRQASQHEVELHIDTELQVYGSEEKLRSVVMNLVTNAIKYTPANGHIVVRWKRLRRGAEFSVTDNGPGIPAEHQARLTERFYRVDKDRSSATGGTGLGLSIVKHALEYHRSELKLVSTPGEGSCFSFVLPPELISDPLPAPPESA